MARIRSLHPGLWTDEAFVSVSAFARLLAMGLWGECDDQGAFEWKPLTLRMRLLPGDSVDVPALLAELTAADLIRQYEVAGRQYGAVRNFARFQRPKKPNSVHPMPDEFRTYAGHGRGGSELDEPEDGPSSPPVPHEAPSVPHQFPTSGEISPQMEEIRGRKKETPFVPLFPDEAEASPEAPPPRVEARGCRLPPAWQPDTADAEFARRLQLDVAAVAASFRDYWHGIAGAKGRKIDWSGTWRNWCRREAERPRPNVVAIREPGRSYAGCM